MNLKKEYITTVRYFWNMEMANKKKNIKTMEVG